jgi:DNA-directed RNA polymerase specialized sigma24 family protein
MAKSSELCGEITMTTHQFHSDRQLLQQLRSGRSTATTALYHRYANRLMGFVRKQLGTDLNRRIGPDDIVQSTFRSFFRRASSGSYDVPDSGELWSLLRTIAANKTKNQAAWHRAQKRDVSRTRPCDPKTLHGVEGLGQEQVEIEILIDELLSSLTDREQRVVRMRIDGHEVAAIATATRSSKRTTERILQQFRAVLSREVSSLDE